MAADKRFQLKIVEASASPKFERRRARAPRVPVASAPREIVRAFKRSAGTQAILERFPDADTLAPWRKQIAFFSVRKKTGTARFLDFWDVDHFDFFTDMQRSITADRAWFSHRGFTTWGSAETRTGRINCFFTAPADGAYSCVVKLQGIGPAVVECLIDNSSFGPLSFNDVKVQPHFSSLSKGTHHFRIRQLQGEFFFLSLTVFRFV